MGGIILNSDRYVQKTMRHRPARGSIQWKVKHYRNPAKYFIRIIVIAAIVSQKQYSLERIAERCCPKSWTKIQDTHHMLLIVLVHIYMNVYPSKCA